MTLPSLECGQAMALLKGPEKVVRLILIYNISYYPHNI